MLSPKDLQEIKKMEKQGKCVVVIGSDGRLEYSGGSLGTNDYCDQCPDFALLPDPDPFDWFRDGDMKAVCFAVRGVIEGSLETPNEMINIKKPLYCPRLGRELTEEEQKKAAEMLAFAQKRLK